MIVLWQKFWIFYTSSKQLLGRTFSWVTWQETLSCLRHIIPNSKLWNFSLICVYCAPVLYAYLLFLIHIHEQRRSVAYSRSQKAHWHSGRRQDERARDRNWERASEKVKQDIKPILTLVFLRNQQIWPVSVIFLIEYSCVYNILNFFSLNVVTCRACCCTCVVEPWLHRRWGKPCIQGVSLPGNSSSLKLSPMAEKHHPFLVWLSR